MCVLVHASGVTGFDQVLQGPKGSVRQLAVGFNLGLQGFASCSELQGFLRATPQVANSETRQGSNFSLLIPLYPLVREHEACGLFHACVQDGRLHHQILGS